MSDKKKQAQVTPKAADAAAKSLNDFFNLNQKKENKNFNLNMKVEALEKLWAECITPKDLITKGQIIKRVEELAPIKLQFDILTAYITAEAQLNKQPPPFTPAAKAAKAAIPRQNTLQRGFSKPKNKP